MSGDPEPPSEEPARASADEPQGEPVESAPAAEPLGEPSQDDPVSMEAPASPSPEEVAPPEPAEIAPEEIAAAFETPPAPEPRGPDATPQALLEFPEPEPVRAPPPSPPPQRPRVMQEPIFGEAEIPLPNEPPPPPQRGRDAQRVLDLDLDRIKRTKRFGLGGTILSVLFIAFVLAPVSWVGAYRFIDAPGTLLMLQRAAEGQNIHHAPVPLSRMSPNIIRAVIASEDQNFCTHHGFDVAAIQDAMESNEDGGKIRGGSTISQQTAKNLFLWPSRSWLRKGLETYFTSLTEFMWPKQRIMEQYLNAAEWGDGLFGVEAASQARFGVHAADLTPLQAARLAAVLPSPNRWRADDPGPYVRRRAATIVDRAIVVHNDGMAACVLALDPKPPAAVTHR